MPSDAGFLNYFPSHHFTAFMKETSSWQSHFVRLFIYIEFSFPPLRFLLLIIVPTLLRNFLQSREVALCLSVPMVVAVKESQNIFEFIFLDMHMFGK